MNIFFLSMNPMKAARYMCDQHVNKMLSESCQMLCTAHRVLHGDLREVMVLTLNDWKLYELWVHPTDVIVDGRLVNSRLWLSTHVNHPCTVWVRESVENYEWLYMHYEALFFEFSDRFRPYHRSFLSFLADIPPQLEDKGFTFPPLCMPDEYATTDIVESYREFYRKEKTFARWRHSPKPEWY